MGAFRACMRMCMAASAELLPTSAFVHCDWAAVEQRWALTHALTCETVILPGDGPFQLTEDEDGFAYIRGMPGQEEHDTDIDTVFEWRVAELPDGERIAVGNEKDGITPRYSIVQALLDFKLETISLHLGPTSSAHMFAIAVFRKPRGGFRSFWSLVSVYTNLNFDMFKGVASRWSWQSLRSFEKFAAEIADGQVVRSQCYEGRGSADEQCASKRCLPWHGVSTAALVWLLCRWAAASTRHGGLVGNTHKQSARFMLKGVVDGACGKDARAISLLVDDGWGYRWPRPPSGDHVFVLHTQARESRARVGVVRLAWV